MTAVAIVGAFSALFISVLVLFFRAGHITARVEALENWRPNIRQDMHEISEKLEVFNDKLGELNGKMENLDMLIRERTERRSIPRNPFNE